jgi:hypothetical protein
MSDPNLGALTALRRLRRVETDAARVDLGQALTRETALAAQYAAMAEEIGEARRLPGDFDREAFAAWFARTLDDRARLADAMRDAEAHSVVTRTTLAHHRVAETAAEEALANAKAVREADLSRREQLMLEDVARALTTRASR